MDSFQSFLTSHGTPTDAKPMPAPRQSRPIRPDSRRGRHLSHAKKNGPRIVAAGSVAKHVTAKVTMIILRARHNTRCACQADGAEYGNMTREGQRKNALSRVRGQSVEISSLIGRRRRARAVGLVVVMVMVFDELRDQVDELNRIRELVVPGAANLRALLVREALHSGKSHLGQGPIGNPAIGSGGATRTKPDNRSHAQHCLQNLHWKSFPTQKGPERTELSPACNTRCAPNHIQPNLPMPPILCQQAFTSRRSD